MIIEGVDPRDTLWEEDWPVYRVYFWHRPPPPVGIAQERMMWHCDEYRASQASDVLEVLDWARDTARPNQSFVLYLEHDDGHRKGLIRLLGVDPSTAT